MINKFLKNSIFTEYIPYEEYNKKPAVITGIKGKKQLEQYDVKTKLNKNNII